MYRSRIDSAAWNRATSWCTKFIIKRKKTKNRAKYSVYNFLEQVKYAKHFETLTTET